MNSRQCTKKCFTSAKSARRRVGRARSKGWRIRTYWCAECRAWHVTNNDKR